MNKSFCKFSNTILGGALICIVALTFASCKNFMNAAEVKREIEEAIEIANSNPVTIYVEAEEGSGTVTPTQLRLKKKERFELRYKPSENWRFVKWEVYNRKTEEPVADAIEFEDETSAETKAKLIKPQEGLVIYAKAMIIPKIISVTPENNSIVPVYTPIVITFNTPVEEPDAASSIFTYSDDSISLTSSYGPIVNYFEEPFFNAEKTVLTIKPKAKLLQAYLLENNISVLDMNVAFSDKIVLKNGNSSINLSEDNKASFSILYKTVEDTTAPGQQDFFASNKPITLENYKSFADDKVVFPEDFERHAASGTFSTFDVTYFTPAEVYKNTVANVIYIYGKYNDSGSGVNSVIIRETRTHDNNASPYNVSSDTPVLPVKYDTHNAVFITNGNVTEFIIAHEVKSKAGAVQITASVADSFDNIVTKSFYVFKIDENCFINFEPRNFDCAYLPSSFYYEDDENRTFNKSEFETSLKRIQIPVSASESGGNDTFVFAEKVFKIEKYGDWESGIENVYLDYSRFSFKCTFTYNNKEYQASDFHFEKNKNHPDRSYWYCDLYTDSVSKTYVDSVIGLKVKLTVTDDLGNSMTKEYEYPQAACVVVDDADLRFYDAGNTNEYLIVREKHDEWQYIRTRGPFYMLDYDYYVIPVNRREGNNEGFCFCGPMSAEPFIRGISQSGEIDYTVELKQEPIFEYFQEENNWGVKFIFADDTWSKFDTIYYTIDEPYRETYTVVNGSKTVKYLIPVYENRWTQPVKELYTHNLKVSINGIKNGCVTETPLEKTIVTITDEEGKYDVIGPVVNDSNGHGFERKDLYTYIINAGDYDSGLNAIYIVNDNGNKTPIKNIYYKNSGILTPLEGSLVNGTNYYLSAREIENSAGESGAFTLEVTDKKNNGTKIYGRKTEKGNDYCFPKRITTTAEGKWKVGSLWVNDIYLLQTVSDSANPGYLKWGTPTKLNDSEINGIATGPYIISDNIFIRLDTLELLNNSNFGSMGYRYFYTSKIPGNSEEPVKSSGNYDYIQALSDKTFLVASDAPTLVQTIKTKKPYYECQTWTIDEWEAYNDAFCVKQMDLTPESPYQFYLIPSSQLEPGDCYVVIAYFPTGITKISTGNSTPEYKVEPVKAFMTSVMVAK